MKGDRNRLLGRQVPVRARMPKKKPPGGEQPRAVEWCQLWLRLYDLSVALACFAQREIHVTDGSCRSEVLDES